MKYKVIVIKDMFQQMDNLDLVKMIGRILNVKRLGYQNKHSSKFLPVSTEDFFCYHVAICEESTLEPIVCYKVVSYREAEYYCQKFPLYEITAKSYVDEHFLETVTDLVSSRVQNGQDVSYSGGWTINPLYKGRGLSHELRDIYTATHYHLHRHFEIGTITGFGVLSVGTYDFFVTNWGLRPVFESSIKLPFTNNLECKMIFGDLDTLAKHKYDMADKYFSLWEERVEYLYDSQEDVKTRKAS